MRFRTFLESYEKLGTGIKKGHTIEARGVKGKDKEKWAKSFKDKAELDKWAKENDATVFGSATKKIEEAAPGKDGMMPLSYNVGKGHTIEAYGVKGMNSNKWRKSFKDQAALEKWVDANDAEVQGTAEIKIRGKSLKEAKVKSATATLTVDHDGSKNDLTEKDLAAIKEKLGEYGDIKKASLVSPTSISVTVKVYPDAEWSTIEDAEDEIQDELEASVRKCFPRKGYDITTTFS